MLLACTGGTVVGSGETPSTPSTLSSSEHCDVCNGQPDAVFGYRYHTSDEYPYILQCLMGAVDDLSSVPTIGIGRPSGRPADVENLTFTHDDIGNGHMTYDYEGESYYIRSTPTGTENCYDFEWKTITNGGIVETGEYCNVIRTDGGMGGGGMGMAGGGMGGAMGMGQ